MLWKEKKVFLSGTNWGLVPCSRTPQHVSTKQYMWPTEEGACAVLSAILFLWNIFSLSPFVVSLFFFFFHHSSGEHIADMRHRWLRLNQSQRPTSSPLLFIYILWNCIYVSVFYVCVYFVCFYFLFLLLLILLLLYTVCVYLYTTCYCLYHICFVCFFFDTSILYAIDHVDWLDNRSIKK